MKNFIAVMNKFTQSKTETDLLAIFPLLPSNVQEHRTFFEEEMFIYPEQHTFYILTSLFIDWIYELFDFYENDEPKLRFLNDLNYLFEFVRDDISEYEQIKVIEQTKQYLDQFTNLA